MPVIDTLELARAMTVHYGTSPVRTQSRERQEARIGRMNNDDQLFQLRMNDFRGAAHLPERLDALPLLNRQPHWKRHDLGTLFGSLFFPLFSTTSAEKHSLDNTDCLTIVHPYYQSRPRDTTHENNKKKPLTPSTAHP